MDTARRRRIENLRPLDLLRRMELAEAEVVAAGMQVANRQAEGLVAQAYSGVKPGMLAIAASGVREQAEKLARILNEQFLVGLIAARAELSRSDKPLRFAAEQLPLGADWTRFYPDATLDWYRQYSLRLAGVQQVAALERTKRALITGIEQGWSVRQQIQEIGRVFPEFSRGRLENIARTETAKIYSQARWQEFSSEPDVVAFEIVGIMDSRICSVCSPRDGKVIEIGKADGNWPPYHCQCRCTVAPIFSWESMPDKPIPVTADDPQPGFGTTTMEIPQVRDRAARQVIRAAGGVRL